MAVFTSLRFCDPFGTLLTEVATYGTPSAQGSGSGAPLDVTFNCSPGGIGVLETTLPLSFNPSFLMEDARIGVWRTINNRPPYLDCGAIFLLRYVDYGPNSITVRAYHATSLIDRRIIAYASGTSFAKKAATFADDLMKTFIAENMMGSISGANRDGVETYADVSTYLTNAANVSLGASIAKTASRRNLLDVCVDIAQASTTAGTYLTFEVYAPTENTLEVRTYATQRGVDRRASTSNPVILSQARGNLTNAHLVIDYTESATFTIAGGTGEGTARLIGTAFDSTRAGNSPFGRIEKFKDSTNVDTQAAVDDEADAMLRERRPLILFTGDLVETPGLTRGIDFDLGDMVTAEHPQSALQYDVRIDVIRETISEQGRRVECGLRSVT